MSRTFFFFLLSDRTTFDQCYFLTGFGALCQNTCLSYVFKFKLLSCSKGRLVASSNFCSWVKTLAESVMQTYDKKQSTNLFLRWITKQKQIVLVSRNITNCRSIGVSAPRGIQGFVLSSFKFSRVPILITYLLQADAKNEDFCCFCYPGICLKKSWPGRCSTALQS